MVIPLCLWGCGEVLRCFGKLMWGINLNREYISMEDAFYLLLYTGLHPVVVNIALSGLPKWHPFSQGFTLYMEIIAPSGLGGETVDVRCDTCIVLYNITQAYMEDLLQTKVAKLALKGRHPSVMGNAHRKKKVNQRRRPSTIKKLFYIWNKK